MTFQQNQELRRPLFPILSLKSLPLHYGNRCLGRCRARSKIGGPSKLIAKDIDDRIRPNSGRTATPANPAVSKPNAAQVGVSSKILLHNRLLGPSFLSKVRFGSDIVTKQADVRFTP